MSGFEIAGVVLGAIPIIIEALNTYNETRKLFQAHKKKKALIRRLVHNLQYYKFSINEQVGKVLNNAGAVSFSEEELRSGRLVEVLKDSKQNGVVIEYLGTERFGLFTAQLVICQEVLAEIVELFEGLLKKQKSIPTHNTAPLQDLILAHQLYRGRPWEASDIKLKFSYKKEEIDEQIKTLDAAVRKLQDRDLHGPLQFEVADSSGIEISSRRLKSLLKSFNSVQTQATRLYAALAACLPRGCHNRHSIRLFLNDRAEVLRRKQNRSVAFQVELLGFTPRGKIETWYRGNIKAQDDEDHNNLNAYQGKVTFNITTAGPNMRTVQAVCSSLTQSQDIEFWVSAAGKLVCTHCTAPCKESSKLNAESLISLEEIIDRASLPGAPEAKWSFQHRMILAFRLACSILQLNRTQWLESSCSSSTVFFQRFDSLPTAPSSPPFEAEYPFVTKTDPPGFSRNPPSSLAHHVVLDLGIVLMELWKLQTFMQWSMFRKRPLGESYGERFQSADLWLRELEPTMLPNYKTAVQRCVELASRLYSFDDDGFRENLCDGVVKPLWESCKPWLLQN